MPFRCTVLTPERVAFEAEVEGVVLPAHDGEIGILPGHADFLGELGVGVARLSLKGSETRFALNGGFLRVDGGSLSVLAEEAAAPEAVDAAAAGAALTQALSERPRDPAEADQRDGRIAWARARLRLKA
jgi:F-type H+-transporting ATPase subunit epsilon